MVALRCHWGKKYKARPLFAERLLVVLRSAAWHNIVHMEGKLIPLKRSFTDLVPRTPWQMKRLLHVCFRYLEAQYVSDPFNLSSGGKRWLLDTILVNRAGRSPFN